MQIGYFLSCEEYAPESLIQQARWAEEAGFESLWISDHFHPWTDEQGQSPFVWSMIGAISQVTSLPVTTAVTCPTVRIHPAIVAQAAATSAVLTEGRFILGIGSGEALNEHVTGARWPATGTRLDMLRESVEVMRALWQGDFVDHHGEHYTVENARLYTLPDTPPPVYVSAFGDKAATLAGEIGDGLVTIPPDADLIRTFRDSGGAGKPVHAGYKVCWGPDAAACVSTVRSMWPNDALPGELAQQLSSPKHFEQAGQLVTEQMIDESVACGDDVDRHLDAFRPYVEAGVDVVHVDQMGGKRQGSELEGFFAFYRDEMLPRMRELAG
ncbi:TIGR03557 family F420-dependent LLM class oxidoreductase [uncultured Jatrophihabitans sp.]|uniref:TIGR03557 family F420-dependent LLM class oxidoreductase n=1 Tax=uncultured Jatrophihabitans sp. TaxID=1610747 RepID=UPI0035CA759F